MTKKIISLFMVLALCFCMIVPVSAESVTPTQTTQKVEVAVVHSKVSPMMTDSILGFDSGTISNYYGELYPTVFSSVNGGFVEAVVSPSSASGTVFCSIVFPNGATQSLGSVSASGGSTSKIPLGTISKGVYTFVFEASTPAELHVSCYVYS